MHDIAIRGGTIADGSGGPLRTADIAVRDGRIVEIGTIRAPARETIAADGALVTPGFIDIHTHYDGQLIWDDRLDPSFSHGVTTAIAGLCGLGFAPVAEHRRELMELMEGVEDIPGAVLDEGLDWGWRSFGDYLDRLAARRFGLDVAVHLPHAPVRVFVMGERALRHEPATAGDVEAMAAIVRDATAAGAIGFSSGRLMEHLSSKGAHVPGTFAGDEELMALAAAMGASGRGTFQVAPRGAVGDLGGHEETREARIAEHRRLEGIARASGRPLTYTAVEFPSDMADLGVMVAESDRASAAGLRIAPQVAARGIGTVHMLDSYHFFLRRPSYRAIAHLPLAERAAAMRDPARRAAILGEADVDGEWANDPIVVHVMSAANLPETYILSSPLDYEPGPERKVKALAAAAGRTPQEYLYDHYAAGAGDGFNMTFGLNYAAGSLDRIHDLLRNPNVVSGLADAGAHMRLICDGAMPTFQLAFWTRERRRGPRLPVELMVRKLSAEPAALYGLADRGTIAVGKRADLNVIDHAALTVGNPRVAHDLPSGAGRLLQDSRGYVATLVAGIVTRRGDQDSGARPGRLVRSGELAG
jgi:N-acyl-D-aspartate/D-glutamate deacylase